VLEDRGFELLLVNARHVRILPGRKTDVKDAEWLAELLEHGLLRGSFVPPKTIRELRDLTRYRKRMIQAHTSECQRIQKTLEDAGIKLDSVASDVLGVSGRAMLTALVAGERDPLVLAELAKGRLRRKIPALRQALRGRFGDHHALSQSTPTVTARSPGKPRPWFPSPPRASVPAGVAAADGVRSDLDATATTSAGSKVHDATGVETT
jgi:transposase